MGWENKTIKQEHMMLFCFCWRVLVPKFHGPPNGPVTPEVAKTIWDRYLDDPKTAHPDVLKMRIYANEMWLLYVQSN